MASKKQKKQSILKQNKLGFFYNLLLTINGLGACFLIVSMIYSLINPTDWSFSVLNLPIVYYVLWPLNILNVIYFAFILINRNIAKGQKIISVSILVFSAIIVFCGLASL